MKYYIGIDPGKSGAIVILNNKNSEVIKHVIPCIGTVIDIGAIDSILAELIFLKGKDSLHLVIEDVHALYGSSAGATFSFGYVCGVLEGIIHSLSIPHTKVQPKVWQKEMFQGIPEIRKPNTKDGKKGALETKQMALLAAKRIFPDVDLRATTRSKNPHDGIVDALLMAEYCRRKF